MSAVGTQPTETYADLNAIINIIKRMTVPPVKQTIKNINDSRIVPGFFPLQGLKKDLVDRLIGIFTSLKEGNMSDEYRESRRLLEEQYGTRISINSHAPHAAPSWSYQPPAHSGSSNARYGLGMASLPAKPSPYASITPNSYMSPGISASSSSSVSGPVSYQPHRRPHFLPTPFLQIKEWVGGAVICPEAPNSQHRSSAIFKLQLSKDNLAMLRDSSAVHQLRLFCTPKTSYDAALHPSHAAPVEFPLICEVKVNNSTLSVNLRGKKLAAKVLAPNINKDKALYFGGQENKVELIYQNTIQQYVLSVAICEVRNADTLARKIRREKYRSKEDVLGAMKRAAEDDDIEMGEVSMGLKCPLSYMRLSTPIRSTVCTHMQCFDALSFYSLNEQTPSWQCPHCNKSIKPDSLFLDGYVLDIVEKVPEEEETVLVDAEGRWHTPNNKYSSGQPQSSDATSKQTPKQQTPSHSTSKNVKAEEEAVSQEREKIPTTPPRPSVTKSNVEVFEIDDDDEEADEGQGREIPRIDTVTEKMPAEPLASSRNTSLPNAPPTATVHNGISNGSEAHQNLLLQPPQPSLQMRDSMEKPTSEVIDLTLSDSEEDEDDVPLQNRMNSQMRVWDGNGNYANPRNPSTPTTAQNDVHQDKHASQTSGHHASYVRDHTFRARPSDQQRHASTSAQSATPRRTRRSNSDYEGGEEEQDADDSLPIRRVRKKPRNNAGIYSREEEDEEEEEEEEGQSQRARRNSNSEGLYEDERAGLTLR